MLYQPVECLYIFYMKPDIYWRLKFILCMGRQCRISSNYFMQKGIYIVNNLTLKMRVEKVNNLTLERLGIRRSAEAGMFTCRRGMGRGHVLCLALVCVVLIIVKPDSTATSPVLDYAVSGNHAFSLYHRWGCNKQPRRQMTGHT